MARNVTIREARATFATIVNQAAFGKVRFVLTRNGKNIVALVPWKTSRLSKQLKPRLICRKHGGGWPTRVRPSALPNSEKPWGSDGDYETAGGLGRRVERRRNTAMIPIETQMISAIPIARFHETMASTFNASSYRCWTITKNPVLPTGANAAIQRPW